MAFVLVLSDQHEEGEESASRSCWLLGCFLRLALTPRQRARSNNKPQGLGERLLYQGQNPFPAVKSAGGGVSFDFSGG